MLKRLRRHLNPPMMVAMIALFAALGGGYATAFSGSGTLQKGSNLGIVSSTGGTATEDIRTLTGIGAIGVGCNTSDGALALRFRNNSGNPLTVTGSGFESGSDFVQNQEVPSNNAYVNLLVTGGVGRTWQTIHISRVDGQKRPQADVNITGRATGSCATAYLNVLALNTQE